jgi:hypothetical protein
MLSPMVSEPHNKQQGDTIEQNRKSDFKIVMLT